MSNTWILCYNVIQSIALAVVFLWLCQIKEVWYARFKEVVRKAPSKLTVVVEILSAHALDLAKNIMYAVPKCLQVVSKHLMSAEKSSFLDAATKMYVKFL